MVSSRLQPRRVARELALLALGTLRSREKQPDLSLEKLISTAVVALAGQVHEALETASDELKRGQERLLMSDTRASNMTSARTMVQESISLTQDAINRLGTALELPEFIQLTNRQEVRTYAVEILTVVDRHETEIDDLLNRCLLNWRTQRLPRIDRDLLRVAIAEMNYLGLNERIAINEAVELAKRYSDEEGYRFINGALRRVSNRLKSAVQELGESEETQSNPPAVISTNKPTLPEKPIKRENPVSENDSVLPSVE